MDLEGIRLSEISQTEKYKYCIILLIHGIFQKNHAYRYGEQIGGCQSWGLGVGEMGEGGQKVQASSYKINKSWGCNVPHGDYS